MKQRNNIPYNMAEIGKVPPQAIEAEESVLGICMLFPDSVNEIRLIPDMFYKEAHRKIFASILDLSKKGPCDLISVTDDLRKKNQLDTVGGPVVLTFLTNNVVSCQMLDTHALIVKQTFLLREYIRVGQQLSNMAYTEDLCDVVEYAEGSLFKLSDYTRIKEPKPISHCIDDLLSEVEKVSKKEKSLVGIPSGFTSIDRITGGWQPGNMIIIAGRPSMGKTALALTLAINPSRLDYPVCFFSLEMSESELAARFLSGSSGYTNVEIRNARLDFDKLVNASNDIALLPIYIDDTPALGLFELRSKIKKMIIRYGIKLAIIDYLQLMKADADNREREVSLISRGLKTISKEFNIPVIALSQLNREVEKKADKRPRLADLRESGAIEQDADIVCFIYRPAVYGNRTVEFDGEDISTTRLMIVDCAKNRNGALFATCLYHNDSLTRINDEEEHK